MTSVLSLWSPHKSTSAHLNWGQHRLEPLGYKAHPAPCRVHSPKSPLRLGSIAPVLQMRRLRHSEGRSFHGSGSGRAGTGSQLLGRHTQAWVHGRSWGRGHGGRVATHTGHCYLCRAQCPPLRPGPRTKHQLPTPAAWQTLLSGTKPRSYHAGKGAVAAPRPVSSWQECPFQNYQ